ncbi:hypothetical protein MMC25_003009 [Agyrium rufum]|nr:hypothetical protein [Agyrium rufum]
MTEVGEASFRPAKRRKQYRRRNDEEQEADEAGQETPVSTATVFSHASFDASGPPPEPSAPESSTPPLFESLSISDLLRQRRLAQRRKAGIEFSNDDSARLSARSTITNAILPQKHKDSPHHPEDDEVAGEISKVVNRFAPQTGLQITADVDKHMMAYIDSELAKRRLQEGRNSPSKTNVDDDLEVFDQQTREVSPGGTVKDLTHNRQPAALGKLHEIDLGDDARLRNIALTEAAQRKLDGEEEEPQEGGPKGRIRLGRDGKPLPRRKWKRRGSDDIKRDKLVEEVLRESKLEIYDDPEAPFHNADDQQAADDRIAEQFRREFLDAISSRRQRSSAAKKNAVKGAKDEPPKGPKLGGSRSARAAMRERELQKTAGKK